MAALACQPVPASIEQKESSAAPDRPEPGGIENDGFLRLARFVQDNHDAGQAAAGTHPDASRETGQFLDWLGFHICGFANHVVRKQLLDLCQKGCFFA